MIRLGQGKVKAAVTAIEAALEEERPHALGPARLLPAQVEILLAAGDVAGRAPPSRSWPGPSRSTRRRRWRPAHARRGRVLLAEGDARGAARELRAANRAGRRSGRRTRWRASRALLALALRAPGRRRRARTSSSERRSSEFQRLGATVERRTRSACSRRPRTGGRRRSRSDGRSCSRTSSGSTTLAEALGDAAWERLLRWHDDDAPAPDRRGRRRGRQLDRRRVLRRVRPARRAVDCAIAIQRALREHQGSIGFAPPIRIGLHTAEANRRGHDYSGIGVHVAARVGALAGSGEILATVETLAEAGELAAIDEREVEVRGVSTPVRVASIIWRDEPAS